MAQDFRSLKIWQEAHNLALEIYKITGKFPKEEKFSLVDQIRRSGVSVAANIAESYGRYHNKDKIQLLIIARGSMYEVRSHLSIALGLNFIDQAIFQNMENKYEILSKQLNSFINHIKRTNSPIN